MEGRCPDANAVEQVWVDKARFAFSTNQFHLKRNLSLSLSHHASRQRDADHVSTDLERYARVK